MDPQFRREHHTAVDRGPCPFYPLSRVTAQGEDILAWLDAAITHHESEARAACHRGQGRWKAGHRGNSYAVSDEIGDVVVYNEGAPSEAQTDHIALNDPESVLRRCAADRKLIAAHPVTRDVASGPHSFGCSVCHHEDLLVAGYGWCDTLLALAEGYGWTEGER
ncbi:hypothetical protein ADL27_14250 [Streptomyces sp. NRRL F-6602]|nr:hypothetical protein ADL27_14250 [Streptomyces sp. NRRL F-6602]